MCVQVKGCKALGLAQTALIYGQKLDSVLKIDQGIKSVPQVTLPHERISCLSWIR